MWTQGSTYTALALGRGKVVSPTLGRLYPGYSFYSTLSGPQEQSAHEAMKKNLHPSDIRARTPGSSSPWPSALPHELSGPPQAMKIIRL